MTTVQGKRKQAFMPAVRERLQLMYSEQLRHMDEKDLDNLIKRGKRKAKKYQIDALEDIRRFIEILLVLGDSAVEKQKPYCDVVADEALSGPEKVDRLEELMLFRD